MVIAKENELVVLRQELHQFPELSGQEKDTARRIGDFFEPLKPDGKLRDLGGEGIAFIFKGVDKGPCTLIRCELDALPITEENDIPYKSKISGKSHTCGHDGHMAIVCGVGKTLAIKRPKRGKVILLFQPAEETGEGAAKVIRSENFSGILPDYGFALHNLPGYEKNEIVLKKGPITAASKGMEIHLKGRTSHAAHPEDGNSPAEAMGRIIVALKQLPNSSPGFSQITVVHAVLGEMAFGTSPGEAVIRATLRTFEDQAMDELGQVAEEYVRRIAASYRLSVKVVYKEIFNATSNHVEPWEIANAAAKELGLKRKHIETPIRWSEDFGRFSNLTKTMFFGLGSGLDHPQLHEPDFDFPDGIIPTGVRMFIQIIKYIHH